MDTVGRADAVPGLVLRTLWQFLSVHMIFNHRHGVYYTALFFLVQQQGLQGQVVIIGLSQGLVARQAGGIRCQYGQPTADLIHEIFETAAIYQYLGGVESQIPRDTIGDGIAATTGQVGRFD